MARLRSRLTALVATLAAASAGAAELGSFYELGPRPDRPRWSAALVLLDGPRYDGSDDRRTLLVPSLAWQGPSGFFAEPVNGLGFNFSTSRDLQYGLRLTVETGRDAGGRLPGFDDIDARLNPGLFANARLGERLELKSALRLGMASGGAALHLGASYELLRLGATSVALNGSVRWGSRDYNQAYFGVTPAQAAGSGLRIWAPGSGINAAQVGLSARVPLGDRWAGFGTLAWQRLQGDAAESPVVRDPGAARLALGVSYAF